MAGRLYRIPFAAVAVSALQDLLSVQATAGMAFRLIEIVLGQVTITTVESLNLSLKRFSGAYTIGSVGAAVTPNKVNFGDSAAIVTARRNDTTQTTGGTSVTLHADVFNEVNGWQFLGIPDKEIIIAPSQALVLSLDTVPGAPRTMSGTMMVEEMF